MDAENIKRTPKIPNTTSVTAVFSCVSDTLVYHIFSTLCGPTSSLSYFLSCYNVTMSTYDIFTVKRAISCYFRLNSFRKASKQSDVPRSTLHGWVSRFGRRLDGRKLSVRRKSPNRRKKRNLIKDAVVSELDANPFHTLFTLKRAIGTSLSLSSLSRVVSDIDYSL